MWDDDKASGKGTLEYSNGDRYEGDWESDQRNGKYKNEQFDCNYRLIMSNFLFYSLFIEIIIDNHLNCFF